MRIAIIGYGRMGKQVHDVALKSGYDVCAVINCEQDWIEKLNDLKSADVAVEFTTPQAVVQNILKCFELNIPVVTGTTGWGNDFEMVVQICEKQNQCLFTASNFSIGVQLFFRLNSYFAKIINQFPEYDISVEETHHSGKIDKPSGTAIRLLQRLISGIERKSEWTPLKQSGKNQIAVNSIREGNVFGIHEVKYTSQFDAIELKHEAHSREGFAQGALTAAKWVNGRKGVFGMNDLLQF